MSFWLLLTIWILLGWFFGSIIVYRVCFERAHQRTLDHSDVTVLLVCCVFGPLAAVYLLTDVLINRHK